MLPARAAEPAALSLRLDGNDIAVTVPANTFDDTSKLYLVWDDVDRGGKLSDWPAASRVQYSGALTSAGGEVRFDGSAVPVGSIVRAIATSDVRLINGWVKLAAYQYIDTGIVDSSAFGTDFKFRPLGTTTGGNYSSVIGSGVDQFTIGMYGDYKTYYLRYGGNGANTQGDPYTPGFTLSDLTVPHVFRVFGGTSYLDGTQVTTGLNNGNEAKKCNGAVADTGHSILLGTTWNRGTGTTSLSGRYCHGEWHYAKVLDASGSPLVNLVPALRGDLASPVACFYDAVSGTWFDKSGGGGALAYDTSASVTNTIACVSALSSTLTTGVTAYWTGLGNLANVNDPANWACTNAAGEEVSGAYPNLGTVVRVTDASNFNIPAGQSLSFSEIHIGSGTLTANRDWSGLAACTQRVVSASLLQYLDAPYGTYIDTGFRPNDKTRVVLDVTVQRTAEYWFGAWNGGYNKGAYSVCNDGGSVYIGYGDNGGAKVKPALSNGRYEIDFSNGVVSANGNVICTMPSQTFQVNYTLFLFGQDRGNENPHLRQAASQNIRFHACKIYDDGVLVRDYVPVQNDAFGCALFDRVTKTYATNSGSGTFSAGPATGETMTGVRVSVPIDSTIDLAGHSLTLANMDGTGTITDTVGGGELHVNVADGETVKNTGMAFAGKLKLVKDGAGTFVGVKTGQAYTGGTLVNAGLLKSGVSATPWGAAKALITVADSGAAFDWNAVCSKTGTPYSFNIKGTGIDGGGAIVFTPGSAADANHQTYCIGDLELVGDALVVDPSANSINAYCGFVQRYPHTLTMNGHTLTVKAGAKFNFVGVTATDAGTIKFTTDATDAPNNRLASFWGVDNLLPNVTLDVAANIKLNTDTAGKKHVVGTFIDRGVTGAGNVPLIVLDRFQPMSTTLKKAVTLGDATHLSPTLDLGDVTGTYVIPASGYALTYPTGATVTVNLAGTRADLPAIARTKDESGNPAGYVLTWGSKPENVTFVLDEASRKAGFKLTADDTGLQFRRVRGFQLIVR